MNYQTRELEELKLRLKPKLRSFLHYHGVAIDERGFFSCISPSHQDNNPSCRLLPDLSDEQYYCYSCGSTGDIFTAARELLSKPIEGLGFIEENVYWLADQFEIEYEKIEFSEEQLEKLEWYRIIKVVASLLTIHDPDGNPIGWRLTEAEERGWDLTICKLLNIAIVNDYDEFLNRVTKSTGIARSQLVQKFEIIPELFGPDKITIPLFDEKGRPIGFSGRYLPYVKGDTIPKYRNSRSSPIYSKAATLYNLHNARRNTHRRLDVFEGFGSVISAMASGHAACVAVCGTAFTDGQVELIQRHGFRHINIVSDPDTDGVNAAYRHMENIQGREGLRVTLTILYGEKDADDLIRTEGLPAFFDLPEITAFDFFLDKEAKLSETSGVDKVQFINRMMKLIINTESKLEQGQQIKALASHTGYEEEDIRSEIIRLNSDNARKVREDMSRDLMRARTTDDLVEIYEGYRVRLDEISTLKNDKWTLGVEESANAISEIGIILRNKKVGIQGWTTGFSILDSKLSGIPKPMGLNEKGDYIPIAGSLVGICGAPQHCKTSTIQNLIMGMAMSNDDVVQLIWSLDDSRARYTERLVCLLSGVRWTAVTRRSEPTEQEAKAIEDAIERLIELTRSGKILLKDHAAGSTLGTLERWVDQMQDQFGKPVLTIIDSFHKIGTSGKEMHKTDFSVTKAHSQALKAMAQTKKISILASIELNKTQGIGQEPHLMHITEARKIEYDFDILATVYNAWYDMEGSTNYYIRNPETSEPMPIIKLNIRKSKEGGSGPVYMVYDLSNFRMKCYDSETINEIMDAQQYEPMNLAGGAILESPRTKPKKALATEKW